MANTKAERSPAGDPIHRYEEPERSWEPVLSETGFDEQIDAHIAKYVGESDTVYHEIASDLVHIDIKIVRPSTERNFYTLVTSGISDLPMRPPEQAKGCEFAELLICLPADWPLDQNDFREERNYWPIQTLKFLARFPHKYDTWIWWGHTIPNGDPPQPLADNTALCGVILAPPVLFPAEFFQLEIDEATTVHFFSVLPLYIEEMNFKLQKGTDDLFDLFDRHRITPLVDLRRPNVCQKSKWPFRPKR